VILTVWGYLLLSLAGLAIGLFCWLSYASLTGAAGRPGKPSRDELRKRVTDIMGAMSPGAG
jgi:hypothetical protein